MLMDLPVVGGTLGPTWASDLNSALTDKVDTHDHTSGKGKQVPTAGILINGDLTFNGSFKATDVNAVGLYSNGGTFGGTIVNTVYVVNGNLYYNNNLGQAVKVTDGATINAASIGGFGGDYGGVGVNASCNYSQGNDLYSFYEDPALVDYSDIETSGVIIKNDGFVGSQYYAKIINPTGQTENYNLTLPPAVSGNGTGKWLTVNSSGVCSFTTAFSYYHKSFYALSTVDTTLGQTGTGTQTVTWTAITAANHGLVTGTIYNLVLSGGITINSNPNGEYPRYNCTIEIIQDVSTVLATITIPQIEFDGSVALGNTFLASLGGQSINFAMTDATKDLFLKFTQVVSNCTNAVKSRANFVGAHPIITSVS